MHFMSQWGVMLALAVEVLTHSESSVTEVTEQCAFCCTGSEHRSVHISAQVCNEGKYKGLTLLLLLLD